MYGAVQDMRRKQGECMPMLASLDRLEVSMDDIEAAISQLREVSSKLNNGV